MLVIADLRGAVLAEETLGESTGVGCCCPDDVPADYVSDVPYDSSGSAASYAEGYAPCIANGTGPDVRCVEEAAYETRTVGAEDLYAPRWACSA